MEMHMPSVKLSEDFLSLVAKEGRFGETVEDALRRLLNWKKTGRAIMHHSALGLGQTRETGAAGNDFGRKNAIKVSEVMGLKRVSDQANEFLFRDRRVVVKSGGRKTTSIGVTTKSLDRVSGILAAFEESDGQFSIWLIDVVDFKAHMKPSRSLSSNGNVQTVSRKVIRELGEFIRKLDLSAD
jgi:hypothetical protein